MYVLLYALFLLAGGLIGFFKSGSKISLFTSAPFAIALLLCLWADTPAARSAILLLLAALALVFLIRFLKTYAIWPPGVLLALTLILLIFHKKLI